MELPDRRSLGAGRIKELADLPRRRHARPLLVTDAGLARFDPHNRRSGFLKMRDFRSRCSPTFSRTRSRKRRTGVAAYRAGKHDGVVAFGGGSGLDTGKVIAFAAGQSRPLWDFEDVGDWWTRADADKIAPVVAVPTTARPVRKSAAPAQLRRNRRRRRR